MARKIPVYFSPLNKKDYCLPACIGMVIATFEKKNINDKSFFELVESISGFNQKISLFGTTPYRALLNLLKRGYKVEMIEKFDNVKFSESGFPFWNKTYGAYLPQEPSKNFINEINKQAELTKNTLKLFPGSIKKRYPTIQNLREFLGNDYLVACAIDCLPLQQYIRSRYHFTPDPPQDTRNHFVLVYCVKEKSVKLHDPFYPKNKSIEVPINLFDKSMWRLWFPNKTSRKLRTMVGFYFSRESP